MFLIKTYVAESVVEGLGVFAAEPVKAGTVMWRFTPGIDSVIPDSVVEVLPPAGRDFVDRYCYRSARFGDGYVLNGDNARYLNHSRTPNTDNSTEVAVALRDIAEGEEITCNYLECCEDELFDFA